MKHPRRALAAGWHDVRNTKRLGSTGNAELKTDLTLTSLFLVKSRVIQYTF